MLPLAEAAQFSLFVVLTRAINSAVAHRMSALAAQR